VVSSPADLATVAEYWERFFSKEVAVAKARATQQGYRAIFDSYVRKELGDEQLHNLIADRQVLVGWRSRLAETKSHAVVAQAQRVLSSMLSAAAEDGTIPHNPLLSHGQFGRRSGSRKLARGRRARDPLAIDPSAWFLLMERLRRGARWSAVGAPRHGARSLERERGALMIALGFMAGLRLPSEALGLRHRDVRAGRLYVEAGAQPGSTRRERRRGRDAICRSWGS